MSTKLKILFTILAFVAIPALTLSVGYFEPISTNTFTKLISKILDILWIVAATFAIVCFVISGIMFMSAMGDSNKVKIARNSVIFGAIGVAVAILAFSVVKIISGVL